MKIFALTGGTGSGKSEVAKRLAESGIPVVDADAVGHELIVPGGESEAEVLAVFGTDILTCGRIDRRKLGAKVFADPSALKQLNAIVHPLLKRVLQARCAELARQGHAATVVNAAILADDRQLEPWLDGLIVVLSPAEVRHRRLVESRGLSPDEAWRRIRAQAPPESKLPLADWVIMNDGDIEELRARANEVATEILERSKDS